MCGHKIIIRDVGFGSNAYRYRWYSFEWCTMRQSHGVMSEDGVALVAPHYPLWGSEEQRALVAEVERQFRLVNVARAKVKILCRACSQ